MARGITENDVHQAADALVASGERPTVERIRAYLGTGSPNTVTRWLESWWRALGQRLQSHATQLALPQAPETVSRLAGQLWSQALADARQHAEAALQQERAALDQERTELHAESVAVAAKLQDAQQGAVEARSERDLARAQALELQQLVAQLRAQVTDLLVQRDGSQGRADRLEGELALLTVRLEEQKAAAAQEREALEAHRRAFEDRAHREIDLARQATKDVRTEMTTALKGRDVRETNLARERDEAVRRSATLQVELSTQRARGLALEEQLHALQAALAGGAGGRKTTSAPSIKRVRKSKPGLA